MKDFPNGLKQYFTLSTMILAQRKRVTNLTMVPVYQVGLVRCFSVFNFELFRIVSTRSRGLRVDI